MKRERLRAAVFALAALCVGLTSLGRAGAQSASAAQVVTAQILDYESGFLFFTTGDGFRVAPNVSIVNYPNGGAASGAPRARLYARVTFDASGTVTKIELSHSKLPDEGDIAAVRRFAVVLSPPVPNPELAPQITSNPCTNVSAGKHVTVTFNIQVPPSTAVTDNVYMTTDQSGWNPQAYKLYRVDALHYRTQLRLLSGTQFHFLFDRGSTQSVQLGEDGIEQKPYLLCIGDADAQSVGKQIYHWGDEVNSTTALPAPGAMPTPYNPAPFPNLPTPPAPP